MPTQVLMPQLGESVVEGTVTKWLKAAGEPVEEFEPLLEINTDKVDTEIPSPATGVLLEITVTEGTIVHAGELLAWIGEVDEPLPAAATTPATAVRHGRPAEETPLTTETIEGISSTSERESSLSKTPLPGRDRELGFISPVVARIAGENNVDLYLVKGTGQGGRITKKDILAYLESHPPDKAQIAPDIVAPAAGAKATLPGKILPHTPVRHAIAEHMLRSKHTSPHVTTVMEADMSQVVAHRLANKELFARDGANLTFTAYLVAASIAALKAHPIVNSSWSEEGVILHQAINIGVAASLGEEGLIVPVIKNADGLSLLGLAQVINDLARRARARELQPDEVRGGTFTITNHGISGSLFATPIINQPQCAILGVGAIQKRVVVLSDNTFGDTIAIRPMAFLTLTFDHRILDGAVADYFLGKVVETLQGWQ